VVIVASFVIDLLIHGTLEDIASLVIILRLWRFIKVINEISVGAAERMDEVQMRLDRLLEENRELKTQLGRGH
jgi:hypothetical protein